MEGFQKKIFVGYVGTYYKWNIQRLILSDIEVIHFDQVNYVWITPILSVMSSTYMPKKVNPFFSSFLFLKWKHKNYIKKLQIIEGLHNKNSKAASTLKLHFAKLSTLKKN